MDRYQNYHFSGQKDGEQIIAVLRRHWFSIIYNLFSIFAAVFLLIGGHVYFPTLFPIFQSPEFSGLFLFLENLFAMVIWILFFLIWIDYYFDVWIITNKRIVDVKQKGLFNRSVSELELEKIQDITTRVTGMIPTFINYGDVDIQTAGGKDHFLFIEVPDPYRVKDIIMNLQKQKSKHHQHQIGAMISAEIKNNKL
ncbi:MAG TPA: hypothetical protein DIT25_01740 [Candidatus Moranbacteria bacterium]|nr:hypothetical protein [Candidatus Moranbacteria bacterium]